MNIPDDVVIQCALTPSELPPEIRRKLGCMYLKRYYPENLALKAHKAFKEGLWKGCVAWALTSEGKVLGWALRLLPRGKWRPQVMVFVTQAHRRKGIGDALLDCCRKFGPPGDPIYYRHSEEARAFWGFRYKKLTRGA